MESLRSHLKSKWLGGITALACAVTAWSASGADSAPAAPTAPAARKTAVFVDVRGNAALKDKVAAFESKLTNLISGREFSVLRRQEVVRAIDDAPADPAAGPDREERGSKLERLLGNSTSALQLTKSLGADFILFVSMNAWTKEMKRAGKNAGGIEASNLVHSLRGSYKLIEGVTGGVLGGDNFHVAKTVRSVPESTTAADKVLNELMEDAAINIAENFQHKTSQNTLATAPSRVEISIAVAARDPQGRELSLPDLRWSKSNELVKGGQPLAPQVRATVEIDGVVVGTTPARLKVAPGRHRLRLTRSGFADLETTIDGVEGLALQPAMQLNEIGLARWTSVRSALEKLETNRPLTETDSKAVEAGLRQLRQGGYKVDSKASQSIYMPGGRSPY
jgi:hypothetical protein